MATHSVERHLGLKVEDYNREIRRLVPHYDELVLEGMELLRRLVRPDARVLDLGSGTGRLAAAILGAMPAANAVLLDIDMQMLGEARKRLAGAEGRATFVHASFSDALPQCDAVVACLSLHHVTNIADKTRIYRAIFESLPPGAPFLNLDATVSADAALSDLTFARWADAMNEHGIGQEAARKHFADWAREEHYFPIHRELTALTEAGFEEPECFWRKGSLAICGGLRR